jgi:hypothetical protein
MMGDFLVGELEGVPAIHAPEPAASNTPNTGTQPAETMAFPFEKRQWGN